MRFVSQFVLLLTVCWMNDRWRSRLVENVSRRHVGFFADAWTEPGRTSDDDSRRVQPQLDSGQSSLESNDMARDDPVASAVSYLSSSSSSKLRHQHSLSHMRQLLLSSSTNKIIDFEHGRFMNAEDQLLYGWSTGPAPNETIANYVSRNCSSCLLREEAKLARIERVKADLLSKLGMKRPPNATAVHLPPFIPHLNGLLAKWGFNAAGDPLMAGDAPYAPRLDLMADDDDSAKTEQIYSLAIPRK
ncbi:unnamed protein product [Soboliphyme baturini]|uniref:TGFb_propeptide domain-containing protein n=1 Tax=Soboliphyme baturini TaxID=241478 RepID=A0A183IBA3_9BILA|nr:unnamed protein product [Soboliphyme baturini]